MKLIVGLGNPGPQYEMTRHNLGFMLIDRLFENAHGHRFRAEANAVVAPIALADERVLLVKPQTFMNLSGNAVHPLLEKYGDGDPVNLLVVCDDVALPFGMLRVRGRGSAGGQKGLQSIIERVGSQDFPRLRLGIKPEHAVGKLPDFVLSPIPKREQTLLNQTLDRACEAVAAIIRDGVERAMSLFNERVKTEVGKSLSNSGQ
ncbi:MAG: aminoacyl-tRNA hydrolase [Acidobacteria bacterium]|nr:aminoacyl-tRNA hydrolase [Acidobacteriota bacterium]